MSETCRIFAAFNLKSKTMRKGEKTKKGKSDMISDKYVRFDWGDELSPFQKQKFDADVISDLLSNEST